MRWPFGHRSTPTDRATATGSRPGTAPAAARPHDAWRSLPAVQRTIGGPPVVAPAAPFAARLATRQAPDLALAPLGHEVSPLASPGVLIGLVSTNDAANTGRIELPVQRHPTEGHRIEADSQGWSQFDDDAGELRAGGTGAGIEAGQPVLTAAGPVAPGAAAAPARSAAVQRLAASAPILTASSSTTVAPPPAGSFDLRPQARGANQPPILTETSIVQRSVATPTQAASAGAESAPPVRRPTLGQARRLGLGAPLAVGSDGSVQRLATAAAADRAAFGPVGEPVGDSGRSARPAADGPGNLPTTGAEPGGATAGAQAATQLAADRGPAALAGPTQLTVVRPLSIQRLASSPSAASVPQRSSHAEGQVPDAWPATSAVREPAVQRLPAGGGPSSGDLPSAGPAAGIATDPLFGPDTPADIVTGPVGGTSIRASLAGSLLDLAPPASRVGGSTAGPRAPGAPPLPVVARSLGEPLRTSPAVAASAAPVAGRSISAQREPVGPVVPRSPAGSSQPTDSLGAPSSASSAGAPAIQRAVEVRELVITTQADNRGLAGEPASGAAPGSAATPAAASAPPSIADRDRELDELARRLYGRIRTKLAAELLADRERAGLLVDLR